MKLKKMNNKIKYVMVIMAVIIVLLVSLKIQVGGNETENTVPNTKTSSQLKGKIVVIDAGHGGIDPGAVRDGIFEKDINLSIALKVKEMLQDKGIKVVMTRSEDKKIPLEERVQISNDSNTDLFVSIHQNAVEDNVTYGTQVWFEKTNKESGKLAKIMQESIMKSINGKDRGIQSNQSLYVTKNTKEPSVLVECGFISSDSERQLLQDYKYQEEIAKGIVNGISQYLK